MVHDNALSAIPAPGRQACSFPYSRQEDRVQAQDRRGAGEAGINYQGMGVQKEPGAQSYRILVQT